MVVMELSQGKTEGVFDVGGRAEAAIGEMFFTEVVPEIFDRVEL